MKVALLGSADGWKDAPWDDPTWEMWALNDQYLSLSPAQTKKVARWFELHPRTALTKARRPDDHWESLNALAIPVYTFGDNGLAYARTFPLAEAIAVGKNYFACTTAYQIALALHEQATDIGVFGAPFCGTLREALVERPCVEWWLGLATGRGVSVQISHGYSVGLGQHPWRYAEEDQLERQYSYDYAIQVFERGLSWLLAEQHRLWKMADTSQGEDA